MKLIWHFPRTPKKLIRPLETLPLCTFPACWVLIFLCVLRTDLRARGILRHGPLSANVPAAHHVRSVRPLPAWLASPSHSALSTEHNQHWSEKCRPSYLLLADWTGNKTILNLNTQTEYERISNIIVITSSAPYRNLTTSCRRQWAFHQNTR